MIFQSIPIAETVAPKTKDAIRQELNRLGITFLELEGDKGTKFVFNEPLFEEILEHFPSPNCIARYFKPVMSTH